MSDPLPTPGRASIVGTGLIGASIGMALRARGWHVSGIDDVPDVVRDAVALGAIDAEGLDPTSELAFVATPVGVIPDAVRRVLDACPDAVVTDVGGVKGAILREVDDPRFVGGHPMAGSEQLGLEGANAELFEGAAWVLTPRATTADAAYSKVRQVVASFGAEPLTLDADQHDALVAVVSHVPHLAAASLVTVAAERAEEQRVVLRLAAGGFRDMTRIAAGSPTIWPDVCTLNEDAIVGTLDRLVDQLARFRRLITEGDRDELLAELSAAQQVRRSLPSRAEDAIDLVEVRVPLADRPGQIAAVAVLATRLGVNLRSLQTIDAVEGAGGVVAVEIARSDLDRFRAALTEDGFRPTMPGPGSEHSS